MGRVGFDGAIEESFNASEETGPCQTGPETGRETFTPIQYT